MSDRGVAARRARIQRLAAKRPETASLDVEVIRREIDDPAHRRRLVQILASLLAPGGKP